MGNKAARPGPFPPHHLRFPLMKHRWAALTFLHWPCEVAAVQPLLPDGLEVEPWEGRAWVGLVPFQMQVYLPVGGKTRPVLTFPETNVRTYVVGPGGRPGVWFFSLDAASPLVVASARSALGLPYFRSEMSVERGQSRTIYRSSRDHPGQDAVGHAIEVAPRERLPAADTGAFENYLTARFRLWHVHLGVLLTTVVEHPPWELRRAEVVTIEEDLIRAAGLPHPGGPPVVHYSDGVDVRVGSPRVVRRRAGWIGAVNRAAR